jgi:two-component system alkaline phosphatase synthesis response regulator PhoP
MSSSSSSSKYTILIVDDNQDLLSSLRFAISVLGDGEFQVAIAKDGAEGLERVYEVHPDCVLIDVKMPTLNGYQLVHVLRGDPDTASIPLVILSALVQERDTLAGMLAGADQYLTKPASPQSIVAAIRSCISLTAAQREQRLLDLLAKDAEVESASEPDAASADSSSWVDNDIWRQKP